MTEFTLTSPPAAWPLLFTYRSPVLGKGFISVVSMTGRLLARQEDGRVWLDGVTPGALALPSADVRTASQDLHNTLTAVFADLAEEADSFDAFRASVQQFFLDTDDESVAEWKMCVAAVQSGLLKGPEGLPVVAADSPVAVEVIQKPLETVTAKDNAATPPQLSAAA